MILINKEKEYKSLDNEFANIVKEIKEDNTKYPLTNLDEYLVKNNNNLKSCILVSKKETISLVNIFELVDYVDFSNFELVAPETIVVNDKISTNTKFSLIIAFSLIRFLQLHYLVKTLDYTKRYNELTPDLNKSIALVELTNFDECESLDCLEASFNSINDVRYKTDINRHFIMSKEYSDTQVQKVVMKKQFVTLPPEYARTRSKVLLNPNTDETKIPRSLIIKLLQYIKYSNNFSTIEDTAAIIISDLKKLDLIKSEFKIGLKKLYKFASLSEFLLCKQDEIQQKFIKDEIYTKSISASKINVNKLDITPTRRNTSKLLYRFYMSYPKVVHADFPKSSEIATEYGSVVANKLNLYKGNTQKFNELGEGLTKVIKFREVDKKYYEQYQWQEENGEEHTVKFAVAMSAPNSKLLRNAAYRLSSHEKTDLSDSVNDMLNMQSSTSLRYFVVDGVSHLVKGFEPVNFKLVKKFKPKKNYNRSRYNRPAPKPKPLHSTLRVEVYDRQTKFSAPFVETSKRKLKVNAETGADASIKLNKYIPFEDFNSDEYKDEYTKGTVYQVVIDPKKYKQISKPFTVLRGITLGDEMAKLAQFLYKGNLTYIDKKNYSLVNGYNPFSIGNFKGRNAHVRLVKRTFNYLTDITRYEFLKLLKVVKPNAITQIRKYLIGLFNQMQKYFMDESIREYFDITSEQMDKFNEIYSFMMTEELFFIVNRRNQGITDSSEHNIDYSMYSKDYEGVRIFSQSILSTDTRVLNTPLVGRIHPKPYKSYVNKYNKKINKIFKRPGFEDLTPEDRVFVKIKTEVILRANILFNKYFDQLQSEIDPESPRRLQVNEEGFDFIGKTKFNRIKSKIFNQILNQCRDIPERYGRPDIDIYSDILKKDISDKVLERTKLIEDYYLLKPVIASYYENLDYKAVLITRYILGLDLNSTKYKTHKKYWFNNPKTIPDKFKEQYKKLDYLPVIDLQ